MSSVVDTPAPVRVRDRPPDRHLWWGMIALVALGLGLIGSLVWVGNRLAYVKSQPGAVGYVPFGCGPGTPCATVLASEYASFLGKSLTKWGFGYYLLVLLAMFAAAYAWQLSLSQPLSMMLPVITMAGVVAAGWSVAIMGWVLEAWCLWCLSVHCVSVALFVLALRYAVQDWRFKQHTRWQAGVPPLPMTPVAIHVLLALVFGASQVAVMTLFHGEESKPVEIAGVRKHILALHRLPSDRLAALPVVSGSAGPGSSIRTFLGPRGAPHRLSVFYCLTSSDCRQLHATLKVLLARHPGELRVDVRFFPLWHGCNAGFDKRRGGQPNACSLARNALAVALSKPEAFADYLDWLFENQHEMTETNAVRQAQSLVEAARWQAAIDDLSLWQRLRQDTELARKLDVLDVPQVFLEVGQAYGGVNVGNLDMLLAEVFGWKSVAREGDDKESVWVARDLLAGHVKRAAAHVKIGRYADAVQELRTAMRIKTDWSEAAAELARILAICPDDKIRNGPDALYFARLAHETTKESSTPVMMEVLAAALAENGRFSEAVAAQRKAMELYKSAGADHQSEAARQRMEMFIQGRPYRLPN